MYVGTNQIPIVPEIASVIYLIIIWQKGLVQNNMVILIPHMSFSYYLHSIEGTVQIKHYN